MQRWYWWNLILLLLPASIGLAIAQPASDETVGRKFAAARLRAVADGDMVGAVSILQQLLEQATGSERVM
ncbi:MAG: hypothetical protein HY692_05295, partial [Cyanobacteria bacterium NC_groundwater_1444_Ag_S-0.65um_54_12]|nr:hypothetical protein [Cyanobacteria bacterium NC_groundwater_1444_Ag_S-0.65um_54_12]